MRTTKDQRGIAHLAVLLLLVFLLLIGFACWRIWISRGDSTPSDDSSSSETTEEAEPEEDESVKVKPPSEVFSVSLPEGWKTGTCPDTPDLLFLAPTDALLGKCNSESFGTVSIGRNDGDLREPEATYTGDATLGSISYDNAITIDGLPGNRVAYTIVADTILGYPPIGTKQIIYHLYDAAINKTYTIGYRQLPGEPDNEAAFADIVASFHR